MRAHTTLWSFLMTHCTPVRPRVATPGEMNMHFLPVSPDPNMLPIPTATAQPNLPQLGCITASSDAVYSSTKSVNTGSAMAANKSVRTVRGPPNTPLLHACGPPCPSRRRQSPLTLLHGQGALPCTPGAPACSFPYFARQATSSRRTASHFRWVKPHSSARSSASALPMRL